MQKRIVLIYTGGTIGMVQDEATGSLVPFDFNHLLTKIPELQTLDIEFVVRDFEKPIDSSNMNVSHWQEIIGIIEEEYTSADGFVVLHGSDTMAYTASALSFAFENLKKPIVLTGSQLPIGILRSDARENLITSLEIASATDENGVPRVQEVCVYFEYNLYRGNRIYKHSSEDFDAFQSPNYPLLGQAGVNLTFNDRYIDRSGGHNLTAHKEFDSKVSVLRLFPGMTPEYVSYALANPEMKALILLTFGSGNAPMDAHLNQSLKEVIKRGVHVVNITQCLSGGVSQKKYEAGEHLEKLGVMSGGDMTFEAALTKMMHLLAYSEDGPTLRKRYQTDLRGELS